MGKRIMIRMTDGSAYNFEMGWWKSRKIIRTLKESAYLHTGLKIVRSVFVISCLIGLELTVSAQSVGIGTTTPNPNAILDIRSSSKGVVFPSLTSAQRDAIVNPPEGLHIYNKDEHCMNYYDSLYAVWNCYCDNDTCKIIPIHISSNVNNLDFNATYASKYPQARKFVILIDPGVTITTGINFASLPSTGYKIRITNRGSIYGGGGSGGGGYSGETFPCSISASNGLAGGAAITMSINVSMTIENYGIIAGGGGGGGGGGRTATGQYGGGGGGGATLPIGTGGGGGGTTSVVFVCVVQTVLAQPGTAGTISTGGTGGTGYNGGGNGGNGGGPGQAGQN